jgi:hypothetical protein
MSGGMIGANGSTCLRRGPGMKWQRDMFAFGTLRLLYLDAIEDWNP